MYLSLSEFSYLPNVLPPSPYALKLIWIFCYCLISTEIFIFQSDFENVCKFCKQLYICRVLNLFPSNALLFTWFYWSIRSPTPSTHTSGPALSVICSQSLRKRFLSCTLTESCVSLRCTEDASSGHPPCVGQLFCSSVSWFIKVGVFCVMFSSLFPERTEATDTSNLPSLTWSLSDLNFSCILHVYFF